MKKKKKKRFNYIKFIVFILIFYLLIYGTYYLFKVPTKNIIILGNNLVTDNEIIETAGIKNYPPLLTINRKKISNNLKNINLINNIKIKKTINFELIIEIEENKVICEYDNMYYLSNGNKVKGNYIGTPILINYVPETTLNKFLSSMKELDYDIINSIGEIKYSPTIDENGNITDEEIFIFYMNDGNTVYISIDKIDIMKKYQKIYASVGDKKGILHLDKGNYLEVQ